MESLLSKLVNVGYYTGSFDEILQISVTFTGACSSIPPSITCKNKCTTLL